MSYTAVLNLCQRIYVPLNYICPRMRQVFTYILLLAFTIAVTPVEWWHECASDHHEVEHGASEDCEICDFEFAWFVLPAGMQSAGPAQLLSDIQPTPYTAVDSKSLSRKSARAPPTA